MATKDYARESEVIQENIVTNVNILKHSRQLTLEELAEKIHVERNTLFNTLTRKRTPLWLCVRLAKYFNVTVDDLINNTFESKIVVKNKKSVD